MRHASPFAFRWMTLVIALFDFLCFYAALVMGYFLWIAFPWHGNFQSFHQYALVLWILPPLGVLVFRAVGLYKPEMGVMDVEEQSLLFKAIWILYVIGFAVSFFYRGISFSRLATFYSIFIAIFMLSSERYVFRHFVRWLHKRGVSVRKSLIYGAGHHGQRLERWIRQSPKLGIKVVGYLDDNLETLVKKPEPPPCLGKLADLKRLVQQRQISILFVAHRKLSEEKIVEILQMCRDIGIRCWIIPSLHKIFVERIELTNIGGIPLVGFREGFGMGSYLVIKRIFDVAISSFLILLLLPLGLLIAWGIKMTSPGPVFFHQKRVGKNGRPFTIIKFRTLNAAKRKDTISPELKAKGSRSPKSSSPFQIFLRKTGLDEIPQLINVLRGHMSIVGPRPEMSFIVSKYGSLERERLTVKPGITGLWQISEDRKRLLIHENMDYDLYYIEHLSFNLDLAILFKTVWVTLKRFFFPVS